MADPRTTNYNWKLPDPANTLDVDVLRLVETFNAIDSLIVNIAAHSGDASNPHSVTAAQVGAPTTSGTGATGTWGISITGSAASASSAGNADTLDSYHASSFSLAGHTHSGTVTLGTYWTVTESGGVLYFKYNGTSKAKVDSSGNLTTVGNITAGGTM